MIWTFTRISQRPALTRLFSSSIPYRSSADKPATLESLTKLVSEGFADLKSDMKIVKSDMEMVKSDMNRLNRKVDFLMEDKLRDAAVKEFGDEFGKSFIFQSLIDVVIRVASSKLWGDDTVEFIAFWAPVAANQLGKKMIDRQWDLEALKGFKDHLELRTKATNISVYQCIQQNPWFDAAGDCLLPNIGKTVNALQKEVHLDDNYKTKLTCFLDYFRLKSASESTTAAGSATSSASNASKHLELLVNCNGPGMMILSYMSNKRFFLNKSNLFPALSLECDLRPLVNIHGQHCTIIAGDIKSSEAATFSTIFFNTDHHNSTCLGVKSAMMQIALRINMLATAVQLMTGQQPLNVNQFLKVGHVYYFGESDTTKTEIGKTELGNLFPDISFYSHHCRGS